MRARAPAGRHKPRGWDVFPAGRCDILGLLARDPGQPLRQLFFFSLVCGATAHEAEFVALSETLVASLDSFTVSQAYVQDCLDEATLAWNAVAKAGQTLSEASDAIWDGWQARTRAEDVTAEQHRDDLHRASYDLSGLQRLPGEASYWDLWNRATRPQTDIH